MEGLACVRRVSQHGMNIDFMDEKQKHDSCSTVNSHELIMRTGRSPAVEKAFEANREELSMSFSSCEQGVYNSAG